MEIKAVTQTDKLNKTIVKPALPKPIGQNLKIGLALGGGGSLGLAHIGVLQVLEENGIKPTHVTGTSMGSIVGAFYAAGIPYDQMKTIALKLQGYQLVDVNLSGRGLIGGKNVEKIMAKYIPADTKFSDLKIKYACNAVSLNTGKEVVLDSGKLIPAIRASSCVPGVFTPVKYGNEYYVDGGLVNNVPDDILHKMGVDYIIAVDVVNKFYANQEIKTINEVLYYSALSTMLELRKYKPKYANIEIYPQVHKFKQYHFNKKLATSVIDLGVKATQEVLPQILSDLKKLERKKRETTNKTK